LQLIVKGQHTSASDAAKNICASTLEQRFRALLSNNLQQFYQA